MWKSLDCKKIAVLGDTHNRIEKLAEILKRQNIDYFLFTGDYYIDALKLSKELRVGFTGVLGNCDIISGKTGASLEEYLQIGGKKVYLLHGHQYRVKEGLHSLYYRAHELEADVVIFGHTHIPFYEKIDDILFLNPGSPSKPRQKSGGTYMLMSQEADYLNIKLHEI